MSDENIVDLHIKVAKMEAKMEVIEKQNEKIEKLVESNYVLSSSIEALAAQVATYDQKTETLIKRMNEAKDEVNIRVEEHEGRLSDVEHTMTGLATKSAEHQASIDKALKQQEEINLKGYKWFKSFFTQFKDKTQTAIIAALVAALGYIGMNVIEVVVKMLMEQ